MDTMIFFIATKLSAHPLGVDTNSNHYIPSYVYHWIPMTTQEREIEMDADQFAEFLANREARREMEVD